MKKSLWTSLAAITIFLVLVVPGQAERSHGGGRGPHIHGSGHGAGLFWDPILGLWLLNWGLWELSRQYYPEPSPVFMEQERDRYPPSSQTPEPGSVYYCTDPQGYYPYVDYCYGDWAKVSPQPSED